MNPLIITIDGPVASGKSTVADLLAYKLGIKHLSSGLFYRALAYIVLEKHPACALEDNQLRTYAQPERFGYWWTDTHHARISYDQVDITAHLKAPLIDVCAAQLAENPIVREFTLYMQRNLAQNHSLVAEGRDLGSVVFPHARLKFFLTADILVRARRWQILQKKLGTEVSIERAQELITKRDTRDSQRTLAPLIIPKNALIIDASDKNPEEIVEIMMDYIKEKRAK